jgi:maltose alpha-D-glucosyltransferase/alpha-amylase
MHLPPAEKAGSLLEPLDFDNIPPAMKELIGGNAAELAHLLGVRTGEMHKSLALGINLPDFRPEDYSLHYQRSLYAGLQSLVRGTFQNQARNMSKLSEEARKEAEEVLNMREDILALFRNIYKKKIDISKIRIHGDYHLGQVLFTGKDFVITDFEGEPARAYSERRLKRCALRDVAGMIRSFHYAAYGSLFLDNQIRPEDFGKLMPFVEQWYHYMSGFFMNAYLEAVEGTDLIPDNKEDLDTLMTTFLLEKAIYELNYELNNRPDWVIIPLRGIKSILKRAEEKIEIAVV